MNNYTSIVQSKKLLELGLNPDTAGMWWSVYGNTKYNPTVPYDDSQWFLVQIRNSKHDDIPCWSVADLMNLIPKEEKYCVSLCFGGYQGDEYISKWFCDFESYEEDNYDFYIASEDNMIDAVYGVLIWAIERGYIKVSEK